MNNEKSASQPAAQSIIHSAPAIVMPANTTVEECVRFMSTRNVGSLLVISDDGLGTLVGIFTERDILKNFPRLRDEDFWAQPIDAVMSSPVRTISFEKVLDAPTIMLNHGIRHLPVIATEKGAVKILGVVSMRDLVKKMFNPNLKETATTTSTQEMKVAKRTVRVVSPDSFFHKMINLGVPVSAHVVVEEATFDGVVLSPAKSNVIVLDIDDIPREKWAALLKVINHRTEKPIVVIAFTPEFLGEDVVKVLEMLGRSKEFAVFAKPIAVTEMFERILG